MFSIKAEEESSWGGGRGLGGSMIFLGHCI